LLVVVEPAVKPVSELLLHEDVWVFVVVVFQPFEGESDVVVVHVLVLPAWAAGENQTPPTAVNAARVVATVRFLSVCMAFTPIKKFTSREICPNAPGMYWIDPNARPLPFNS
jgi:hypothetical protein